MTDSAGGIPLLKPGCRLSPAGDVLLIPEGVLRLGGPGSEILRACDGKKTLGDIVNELTGKFPAADREILAAETSTFLRKLVERGVIEFR